MTVFTPSQAMKAKRFTDSELAAEYWCEWKNHDDFRDISKQYQHYAPLVPVLLARTLTFERFATRPHHDEEAS